MLGGYSRETISFDSLLIIKHFLLNWNVFFKNKMISKSLCFMQNKVKLKKKILSFFHSNSRYILLKTVSLNITLRYFFM